MEFSTLLIGIGALVLFIGPIAYLSWAQKKSGNSFLKQFMDIAQESGLQPDKTDYWNRAYAIGIDSKSHKLLYMHKKESGEVDRYLIDLDKVDNCRVLNDSRMVKESNTEVVNKLSLNFRFRDYKIQDKELCFYNSDDSLSLNDELILVKKWSEIINTSIN